MLNRKWFDYSFLAFGLLVQVVTFFVTNHLADADSQLSILSLVSGCFGVFSVCLASQGNILTFLFGFAQVGTYTYLCVTQRFYGEIAINIYYFLTMIYGVYIWRKRLDSDSEKVTTRRLKWRTVMVLFISTILVSWLVGWGLESFTDDTQPYLDAFTTVPALVAQILMILVFWEHWFIWLAVDILSVALWIRAEDYCMAAQYAFWCANCIYGLYNLRKLAQ